MKNYYDELEVSKVASKEVIEKVYKILAKKYHPDTTKESNKRAAEEKFKAISEAYEILSNDEKRKKYDLELEQSTKTISYEDYIKVVNERNELKNILNKLVNSSTTNSYNTSNNYQHTNVNYNNQTNSNNYNSRKKTYYYNNTEKTTSAFDYFKYKAKEFFTSLIILIFSLVLSILIVGIFTNFNFLTYFIK